MSKNDSVEAMKLALEALKTLVERFDYEQFTSVCELDDAKDAIKALEEALVADLSAPKQEQGEPVAWMDKEKFEQLKKNNAVLTTVTSWGAFDDDVPLYTTPQQRKPLTDEQIMGIARITCIGISPHEDTLNFVKAIEAAHGIKE
jgi:hypothetical protein